MTLKDTTADGVEADILALPEKIAAAIAEKCEREGLVLVHRSAITPPATGDGAAYKAEVERVNQATDAEIGGIDRRFAASPAPAPAAGVGLSPNDWLLLDRLARENRHDGARPVIEKDQAAWDQAFRLSSAGLIAIEQIAVGAVLHITRLGTKALGQFLADAHSKSDPHPEPDKEG